MAEYCDLATTKWDTKVQKCVSLYSCNDGNLLGILCGTGTNSVTSMPAVQTVTPSQNNQLNSQMMSQPRKTARGTQIEITNADDDIMKEKMNILPGVGIERVTIKDGIDANDVSAIGNNFQTVSNLAGPQIGVPTSVANTALQMALKAQGGASSSSNT